MLSSRETRSCRPSVFACPRKAKVRHTQPSAANSRARAMVFLAATPAMDEQHARQECPGRDQRAEDVRVLDPHVNRLIAGRHKVPSRHIW